MLMSGSWRSGRVGKSLRSRLGSSGVLEEIGDESGVEKKERDNEGLVGFYCNDGLFFCFVFFNILVNIWAPG